MCFRDLSGFVPRRLGNGAEARARLEDLSDEEMERLQNEYRRRADSLEDSLADKRKSRAKTKPQ
jgi:hypothetical protein